MSLTYDTDKLFAIQGLANAMEDKFGLKYLAGHWDLDLMVSLTWKTFASSSPPVYNVPIAPSWSWASVKTAKLNLGLHDEFNYYPPRAYPQPVSELLDFDFLEPGSQTRSHQSSCRLHLRGPLCRIWGDPRDKLIEPPPRTWPENWHLINAGEATWEPRLGLCFRVESASVPETLLALGNEGDRFPPDLDIDELGSKMSHPGGRVGINITLDSHRKVEFWEDLELDSEPLDRFGKTYGLVRPSNGDSNALFILWLSVEDEFDVYPGLYREPIRAKGLFLKQTGSEGETPICKRLGTVASDLFVPDRKELSSEEIYKTVMPDVDFTDALMLVRHEKMTPGPNPLKDQIDAIWHHDYTYGHQEASIEILKSMGQERLYLV